MCRGRRARVLICAPSVALLMAWLCAATLASSAQGTPYAQERLLLEQVRGAGRQGRFAAMESLATVVVERLEHDPHPDSLVLAEACYRICYARNVRRQ